MVQVEGAHVIEEILFDIANKDMMKAKLVLQQLDKVGSGVQRRVLLELCQADDDFAIPALAYFSGIHKVLASENPTVHDTLVSKAMCSPGAVLRPIESGPKDEGLAVLIELAGEIGLEAAIPALTQWLSRAVDVSFLGATLLALGNLGATESVSTIAEFLCSGNKTLSSTAASVLGQIGTPEAMRALALVIGTDTGMDLQVLQIFGCVQDHISLQKLDEALCSKNADVLNLAKSQLTRIGSRAIPYLEAHLSSKDSDLLIHTLNVLGAIGDTSATPSIRNLIHLQHEEPNVRFAAYEALGCMSMAQGAYVLADGMTDPVEYVRIAAAKAIDRNFNPVLATGIRNLIQGRDEDARRIITAIITSEAGNILLSLVDDDFFVDFAVQYLVTKAHPEVRARIKNLLAAMGHKDLASRIDSAQLSTCSRPVAVAVDDSKMVLSIYRSSLHDLGYEPILFAVPEEAIQYLEKSKPSVVFTDLNMPGTTGIKLTQQVRQWYDPCELPIIMVTTEDETGSCDVARDAGVSTILHKPFTSDQLKEALAQFACQFV